MRGAAPYRAYLYAANHGIATAHPERGADASHRGGNPGFVRIVDAHTLLIPDYAGNTMFLTLGNIQANPRAGLLFVDFASGSLLQLSGTAEIGWDSAETALFAGAERVLRFIVTTAVELRGISPLRAATVAAAAAGESILSRIIVPPPAASFIV